MFDERFAEVEESSDVDCSKFSRTRKRLIGAFFCHEYSYAAAALMNPSIVPHPDQSGISGGACRFVMSLRAVGEGHISSIAFREGIANPDGTFSLWPLGAMATSVDLDDASLHDSDSGVIVHRHRESSMSNTVIFPITEQQRGGLEDLRLVRFDHGGGDYEWIGTYTAYSGHSISSERLDRWGSEGKLLMQPKYPWEFIQIGNCGSPILTDAGWLLFTHGVGAMRKYSLGCALLDRDNPAKVIGRTAEPVLTAIESDRSGYVPNVVYTCGALKVGERLLVPYGISDSAVGFATVEIKALLD